MWIRKKGFTLIEVVVVVIIIAILTTISFAIYTKAIERARDEEAKTALRLIYAAQKIYFMKHNEYFCSSFVCQKINDINAALNLRLNNTYWDYWVWRPDIGWVFAIRKNPPPDFNRTWQIDRAGEITCNSGSCIGE